MKPRYMIALTATMIVLFLALGAYAYPAPRREHPAYLHALSDLRYARALLDRPDGGELHRQEKDARHELDRAIDEIKKAAIDDGKDINEHPPIDNHLPWGGRLHKAMELINSAHRDVAREEDDPAAVGSQARALEHIDKARFHVREAIALVR
jgi:hypothetical protein